MLTIYTFAAIISNQAYSTVQNKATMTRYLSSFYLLVVAVSLTVSAEARYLRKSAPILRRLGDDASFDSIMDMLDSEMISIENEVQKVNDETAVQDFLNGEHPEDLLTVEMDDADTSADSSVSIEVDPETPNRAQDDLKEALGLIDAGEDTDITDTSTDSTSDTESSSISFQIDPEIEKRAEEDLDAVYEEINGQGSGVDEETNETDSTPSIPVDPILGDILDSETSSSSTTDTMVEIEIDPYENIADEADGFDSDEKEEDKLKEKETVEKPITTKSQLWRAEKEMKKSEANERERETAGDINGQKQRKKGRGNA